MDRQITHTGALIPNATLLGGEKAKLFALGHALDAILGGATSVGGLSCTPTSPASLQVVIGTGSIMTKTAADTIAFGDLGTDSTPVVKQGLLLQPLTLPALTPPNASGYSQVFLVQATQADQDSGTVLPYYNAANPAQPFNGPNNSGVSDVTLRTSACVVAIKPGIAAVSGTQQAPAPDVGYTGLYAITLTNGQSQITTANIAVYPGAPFIPVKLPAVPAGVQAGLWTYGEDTGTADAYAVNLIPSNTALTKGQRIFVRFSAKNLTAAPVININGTGNRSILLRDGTAPAPGDIPVGWRTLFFDGQNLRFEAPASSEILTIIVNSGQVQVIASGVVIWVRTDGSNANDGSANDAAHAFATITAAISAARKYSAVGGAVTIRLGMQGTYAAPNGAAPPGSNLVIYGDPAAQGGYILSGSGGTGQPLVAAVGCQIALVGISIANQGTTNYSVGASGGGALSLTNVTFYTAQTSTLFHIAAFGGGSVGINGGVIITSGMGGWALASGGAITFSGATVTFVNNPTWTDGGVKAIANGNVQLAAVLTISGSAQGPRFSVSLCGTINTNGSGVNLFPGSSVPSSPYPTGGQYA